MLYAGQCQCVWTYGVHKGVLMYGVYAVMISMLYCCIEQQAGIWDQGSPLAKSLQDR